jgi:hypothetical protein
MASIAETASSCARTDAKPLDRDVQMKYDIAKNEEGPLRRTVKAGIGFQDIGNSKNSKGKQRKSSHDELSREQHPGLDERLVNMETHLAVRYGKDRSHVLHLEHRLNTVLSTFSATVSARPTQILGRLYHTARERLSTMGCSPFQSTSSWGKSHVWSTLRSRAERSDIC